MKKIIATFLVCGSISMAVNAQDQNPSTTMSGQGQRPQFTKEQREAMKQQKETDLLEAMNFAQLTNDEKAKAKDAIEVVNKKKGELRRDATLTDDQKKETKKKLDAELKSSLMAAIGEAKYKKFKEFQKTTDDARRKSNTPRPESQF